MVKELRRKGVTLRLHWEEYPREHPDGYQPPLPLHRGGHARQPREPVRSCFVDYAGDHLAVRTRMGGKQQPAETFARARRPAPLPRALSTAHPRSAHPGQAAVIKRSVASTTTPCARCR